MSTLSHIYQDFADSDPQSFTPGGIGEDIVEDQKLQSFEDGYQAGWDDGVKASSEDSTRIAAGFGQNLLDMSFTYHEALTKIIQELQPLMTLTIEKLLPEIARETLGAHITAQVNNLIQDCAGAAIEIAVSPANENAVANIMPQDVSALFSIKIDASLDDTQAFVTVGKHETKVDIGAVISEISQSVRAIFNEPQQEKRNG